MVLMDTCGSISATMTLHIILKTVQNLPKYSEKKKTEILPHLVDLK